MTLRRLTFEEQAASGKRARAKVPRASHAAWEPRSDRSSPVDLLEWQASARIPELGAIRYGRMLVSPFSYFRGAALPMAADLAATPQSGLEVRLCGDAHLSNFGVFGSPERHLFFDVNDFDETSRGPWEWDVKRLATSLEIAGRDHDSATRSADGSSVLRFAPTGRRCGKCRGCRCSRCGTRALIRATCCCASGRCSIADGPRACGERSTRHALTTVTTRSTTCAGRWVASPGSSTILP